MNAPAASIAPPADTSILSPRYRATTLGMVALVALVAFEALAVAAAMPTVAQALDGLRLYAVAFGGALAAMKASLTRGFSHGVASGEPGPNSVLLWTRFVGDNDTRLTAELSATADFSKTVAGDSVRP